MLFPDATPKFGRGADWTESRRGGGGQNKRRDAEGAEKRGEFFLLSA